MLAKERKPQAHSPSLRSIKHCNQPVLSQRRAQNEYSSRKERKKPKLLPAISLKGRIKQKAKQENKKHRQKPHLPTAISPKGRPKQKAKQESKKAQAKAPPPHSDFAQRKAKAKSEAKEQKSTSKSPTSPQRFRPKGEERRASQRKNSVLSFKAKSGEAEHGEKKRRLFERSEFLRFRRAKPRSRLETADGGFSFCYLFLFAAKKKK